MRRSYEALPPHHAWAPGYYYSGLGPGDAPQLQAERVKQQWHAGRSGTKLSDGSPAKPSGYAKREVESARRKPVQRVLAPGWEQQTDEESGEIYFYNEETGETTYEPPVAAKGRRAKKTAAPDSLARVGMLAADMRRELMRQETAPQALGERRTEAAAARHRMRVEMRAADAARRGGDEAAAKVADGYARKAAAEAEAAAAHNARVAFNAPPRRGLPARGLAAHAQRLDASWRQLANVGGRAACSSAAALAAARRRRRRAIVARRGGGPSLASARPPDALAMAATTTTAGGHRSRRWSSWAAAAAAGGGRGRSRRRTTVPPRPGPEVRARRPAPLAPDWRSSVSMQPWREQKRPDLVRRAPRPARALTTPCPSLFTASLPSRASTVVRRRGQGRERGGRRGVGRSGRRCAP